MGTCEPRSREAAKRCSLRVPMQSGNARFYHDTQVLNYDYGGAASPLCGFAACVFPVFPSSAVNMVTTDVIGDTFTDIYQKTMGNYTNKAKTGICKESHTLRASYQCPRTFLWLRQGAMETMGAMETVGAMETMGTYEPRSRKAAKRALRASTLPHARFYKNWVLFGNRSHCRTMPTPVSAVMNWT